LKIIVNIITLETFVPQCFISTIPTWRLCKFGDENTSGNSQHRILKFCMETDHWKLCKFYKGNFFRSKM